MAILIIFLAIIVICLIFPSSDNSKKNNRYLQLRKSDDSKLSSNYPSHYLESDRTKNTKIVHGNCYEFNNCTFNTKNFIDSEDIHKKALNENMNDRLLKNSNYIPLEDHTDDINHNLFSNLNNKKLLKNNKDELF